MNKKLIQFFYYQNSLKSFGGSLILFCLIISHTSCKKQISKSEDSFNSLKFFSCGLNDKVRKVKSTPDGGFLYCGVSGKDSLNYEAFLLKVDGKGNQEWYRTYGGPNYDEFSDAIATSDGGFLAVGITNSFGPSVSKGTYSRMDYEVKLNSVGDTEWCRSMLPYNALDVSMNSVMEGQDHCFYATGSTYNSITGNDVYLLKFDNTGNKKYFKLFTAFTSYPPGIIGSTYLEFGCDIFIANDGSVLIGGVMSPSNLSSDAYNLIPFVISANPDNGSVNFFYPYYKFRNKNYDNFDIVVKIANLTDGFLIGSSLRKSPTKLVMLLLKTDLMGNLVWDNEYEGLGNALLQNLNVASDGAVMLSGSSIDTILNVSKSAIFKTDKDGNLLRSNFFGGIVAFNGVKCIHEMPSGNWSLAAWLSPFNSGFDRIYRFELDENLNFRKQ